MSQHLPTLLLALLTLTLTHATRRVGCLLFPTPGMNGDTMLDVEIPIECKEGTVEWHYPKGSLHLHTSRTPGYTLCLQHSWGPWLGKIYVLTDGVPTSLRPPTKDHPRCTNDLYGGVDIKVDANPNLYFVVTFKYKIVYPDFLASLLNT